MKQQHHQTPTWKLALPAVLLAGSSLLVQAGSSAPAAPVAQAEAQAQAASPLSADAVMRLPLNARHALVLDDATGRVLLSKDADAQVAIASLTKLVTAMVVLDAGLDLQETIHIGEAALTRGDAMRLMIVVSDNAAARALAQHFPGGSEAFMRAMQAKAASLGLTRTAFGDPVGLSPANRSTAVEVATILAAASRYPAISSGAAEVRVGGKPRALGSTNARLGVPGWDIALSKTGYSQAAGRCVAMRVNSGGRALTVVLLHADDEAGRQRDAQNISESLARG